LEGLAWLGLLKRRSWAFKKEGLGFVYYNILKNIYMNFKKKSLIAPITDQKTTLPFSFLTRTNHKDSTLEQPILKIPISI
jgi:hypothetical protein